MERKYNIAITVIILISIIATLFEGMIYNNLLGYFIINTLETMILFIGIIIGVF